MGGPVDEGAVKNPRWECGVCGEKFGYQENLRDHVGREHLTFKAEEEPMEQEYVPPAYTCPYCNERIADANTLRTHLNYKHNVVQPGEKSYYARREGEEPIEADVRPNYYNAGEVHEVGKCLEAWGAHSHAYLWTALVYQSRCGKKPGQSALADLRKARWYIDQEINLREGRGWGDVPEEEQ